MTKIMKFMNVYEMQWMFDVQAIPDKKDQFQLELIHSVII